MCQNHKQYGICGTELTINYDTQQKNASYFPSINTNTQTTINLTWWLCCWSQSWRCLRGNYCRLHWWLGWSTGHTRALKYHSRWTNTGCTGLEHSHLVCLSKFLFESICLSFCLLQLYFQISDPTQLN